MRIGIAALLVVLLVGIHAPISSASPPIDPPVASAEGTWMGTLEAQGVGFPFAVTFGRVGGSLRGDMDILASLSPDIELADIRVNGESISFSLPLSSGESLSFDGRVSELSLIGQASYSGDGTVRGRFTLRSMPFDSLPAWARGGDPWTWPDTARSHWPTKEWAVIDGPDAGLDTRALSAASETVRERFPALRALLICRGGRLAHEEYFHGGSVTAPINIKSVSKGIITALVGVALRQGHLASPDQELAALVPQYFEKVGDAQKAEIRLHHLLDMSSGLHWIENGAPTGEWARRGHSSAYYLSLPLECTPGDCFNYSTASTHLISEILALRTGSSTRAFAEKHVFDPIGVEVSDWWRGANGVHIGGAELLMTARDMARIGLLVLSQGMWDGREVVPADWIHECIAYHGEGQPFVGSYGYGWWRRTIDGHPAIVAKGYGGQFIVIVPDSDLVVVVGSGLSSPEMAPAIEHWICESVVPVVLPEQASGVPRPDPPADDQAGQ